VLIIDEAQMLSVDVLEQLRLLTNLETNERKLLQIVLIGQPELRTMLERPDLEQLAQRVIARFHLKALSSKETEHYIRHRLSVAGMTRAIPFDRQAIQRIHEIARGVPRRINLLCDRAMLGAYAHGVQHIDSAVIEKAAREVFGRSEPAGPDRSRVGSSAGLGLLVATGLALTALLAFAIYGAWRRYGAPEASVAAASAASAAASAVAAATSASTPPSGAAGRFAWRATSASAASAATAPASAAPGGSSASSTASVTPTSGAPAVAASAAATSTTVAAASEPAGPPLGLGEIKVQWKTLTHDEKSAWRQLAPLWKVGAAEGDACAAAARQQVRCFKFPATLATIRRLDRPGLLGLRDDAGRTASAVLVGLHDETATLRGPDGHEQAVSVPALAKLWQGEFGTLWRLPPGYTTAVAEGASGPLVDRLATQLATVAGEPAPPPGQVMDAALRAKVTRFQAANGLSAVGKAGPTTFMQLNRATGVDEPRLAAPRP
jgi:general secretion pathway protein A